ncbi:hypothetical protein QYE76_040361 [Lolium multiflorum]|uniref:Myb-like domain-containing protein n=1 Tax=Lolium multiflorum TaxID=4521 RepID=A0AAD8TCN6_LOLMU|nr:hypothetical protein QYE76_040361 [Lolium multiflorum]
MPPLPPAPSLSSYAAWLESTGPIATMPASASSSGDNIPASANPPPQILHPVPGTSRCNESLGTVNLVGRSCRLLCNIASLGLRPARHTRRRSIVACPDCSLWKLPSAWPQTNNGLEPPRGLLRYARPMDAGGGSLAGGRLMGSLPHHAQPSTYEEMVSPSQMCGPSIWDVGHLIAVINFCTIWLDGRAPCCERTAKKGPWTQEEDEKLVAYIKKHGQGNWRTMPANAGEHPPANCARNLATHAKLSFLMPSCRPERCGKSCRPRWTNHRPDIKRGRFSFEEEETIIQLHSILGNKN